MYPDPTRSSSHYCTEEKYVKDFENGTRMNGDFNFPLRKLVNC